MSLYLAIFEGESEVAGVEVGPYADFDAFRRAVAAELEGGAPGSRFPALMLHSDCEGEWSLGDCARLLEELATLAREMERLPARPYPSEWQAKAAGAFGREPRSAAECFVDVDGQPLLARLHELARLALDRGRPILFQ